MKRFLKKVVNRLGIDIRRFDRKRLDKSGPPFAQDYGHNLGYDLEDEANAFIQKVRLYTMSSYVELLTLWEQAVFCEKNGISGSFVECGVWKGGSVGLMALANLKYGQARRQIHLFDAFDDICEPELSVDGQKAVNEVRRYAGKKTELTGRLVPLRGIYDAFGGPGTLAGNKAFMEETIGYPPDCLHYHKGWFQDTLPDDHDRTDEIAILRLDSDWYASMEICLRFLYEKVVPGGFIIVDDYGLYDGCRKAVDEFLAKESHHIFLHYSSPKCRYWIKP